MKNFKKYLTSSSSIKRIPYLRKSSSLWRVDRHTVARGVAAGLCAAFVPIIPFQTLLAILFAVLIRGNLAFAFLLSWISNPLTYLPIAYFTFHVGEWALGKTHTKQIYQLGKTYLVGMIIMALIVTIMGYCLTLIAWHSYEFIKKQRKK